MKAGSFNYTYTLVVLDEHEQRITALVTCKEIAWAKMLARSCLRLTKGTYVDVYPFVARIADLEGKTRVVRVSMAGEQA